MATAPEVELKNYGDLGRYRVRLVASKNGNRIDVREYLDGVDSGYVGFTRKGIRLDRTQAEELAALIAQALKDGL